MPTAAIVAVMPLLKPVRKLMAEEMRAEDFGVESEEDESDESDDDGDAKATLGAPATR